VSGYVRVVRACGTCGRLFHPKGGQRYCSVPCRGSSQRKPRGLAAARDELAVALIRDWSPARRARIRAQSAGLGEAGLVELIDQVEAAGR